MTHDDIPDITTCDVENDLIKYKVKRKAETDYWLSCFASRLTVKRHFIRLTWRPYHSMNRVHGRAILLWRCGALKFRTSWTEYHAKKGNSLKCPWDLCVGDDSLQHAMQCMFMNTKIGKWDENASMEARMAKYLTELNNERKTRFQMPIF